MQQAAETLNSVKITLNYHGRDVILDVDEHTANVLLNDPDEAALYLQQLENILDREGPEEGSSAAEMSADVAPHKVWTSKKGTQKDHEATNYFLELRAKMDSKFSDKKTQKNTLWKTIAEEMEKKGYYLGGDKERVEKCRQKFANLQKQYFSHVRHMQTTGAKKKDPPLYFSEMHDILGCKDKSNPENLQDSMEMERSVEDIEIMESGQEQLEDDIENTPSTSHRNRFKKTKKSVRPSCKNEDILKLMEKHHNEAKEDRDRQFSILEGVLREQNEQRERMLQQFERFVNAAEARNKRKRGNSDSGSSD